MPRESNDRAEGNDKCWTHVSLTISLPAVSVSISMCTYCGQGPGSHREEPRLEVELEVSTVVLTGRGKRKGHIVPGRNGSLFKYCIDTQIDGHMNGDKGMTEWARPKPLVFSSSISHETVCCALFPKHPDPDPYSSCDLPPCKCL